MTKLHVHVLVCATGSVDQFWGVSCAYPTDSQERKLCVTIDIFTFCCCKFVSSRKSTFDVIHMQSRPRMLDVIHLHSVCRWRKAEHSLSKVSVEVSMATERMGDSPVTCYALCPTWNFSRCQILCRLCKRPSNETISIETPTPALCIPNTKR